jgi:hypothetical protein
MIYEERYTTTTVRGTRDYLNLFREKMVTRIRTSGGEPLLLLQGMIGDRGNSLLQITRFPDLPAWERAQTSLEAGRESLVDSEEIRLLKSVSSRPKKIIPKADRRPVYSYRKLFINPSDLEKFVDDSEKGVWPLYEEAGCRIFGLFTTIAATNPLELILMTGYKGAWHWEETRFLEGKPKEIDQKLFERGRGSVTDRSQLSVRGSWVRLWRAHEI